MNNNIYDNMEWAISPSLKRLPPQSDMPKEKYWYNVCDGLTIYLPPPEGLDFVSKILQYLWDYCHLKIPDHDYPNVPPLMPDVAVALAAHCVKYLVGHFFVVQYRYLITFKAAYMIAFPEPQDEPPFSTTVRRSLAARILPSVPQHHERYNFFASLLPLAISYRHDKVSAFSFCCHHPSPFRLQDFVIPWDVLEFPEDGRDEHVARPQWLKVPQIPLLETKSQIDVTTELRVVSERLARAQAQSLEIELEYRSIKKQAGRAVQKRISRMSPPEGHYLSTNSSLHLFSLGCDGPKPSEDALEHHSLDCDLNRLAPLPRRILSNHPLIYDHFMTLGVSIRDNKQ